MRSTLGRVWPTQIRLLTGRPVETEGPGGNLCGSQMSGRRHHELVDGDRCHVLLMVFEVAGRWSREAVTFLIPLACNKSCRCRGFCAIPHSCCSSDAGRHTAGKRSEPVGAAFGGCVSGRFEPGSVSCSRRTSSSGPCVTDCCSLSSFSLQKKRESCSVFQKSPNAHFGCTSALNRAQNSTRRPPREGRKNENCGGRGGKKRDNLGPPNRRAPHTSTSHPFSPTQVWPKQVSFISGLSRSGPNRSDLFVPIWPLSGVGLKYYPKSVAAVCVCVVCAVCVLCVYCVCTVCVLCVYCVCVLVCWCVGVYGVCVCWCVGVCVCVLVCWCVGVLVCWCVWAFLGSFCETPPIIGNRGWGDKVF